MMQEIFVCLKLTGFDFLYHVLIAGDEVSMFALTIGTDFRVFHRWISLFAVLAEGHRFDRLNLELRFLEVLGLFYRPIPAVNDVLRDDSADLTDLQRYTADLGQIILVAEFFDFFDDIKHCSKLMHGFVLR